MATTSDAYHKALEALRGLSHEEQQRLIEQVESELNDALTVKPLALGGIWKGIRLSKEDIDQARRECWKGLGN